jgi:hypothetical protein
VDELYNIAVQAVQEQQMQGGATGGIPNVTQPGTAEAGAAAGINNIRGGRPT